MHPLVISLQWEYELHAALAAEYFYADPVPALSLLQAVGKHGALGEQVITAIKAKENVPLAESCPVCHAMFAVLAEMGNMKSHP